MAVDEGLLNCAVLMQHRRPILRLYSWSRPALSIGAHQRLSDELVSRCAKQGVEIVRRPTGGTAVLHGDDLTYCVVAPTGNRSVLEAYHWVAEGIIAGLELLEIPAEVGGRVAGPALPGGAPPLAASSACFATTLGADLRVGDSKICGSAQVRRAGWFLQHGSIPLRDSRPLTRGLLRHPGPNNSTCLELLRPGTTHEEAAGCLVSGFGSRWGRENEVTLETFCEWSGQFSPQASLYLPNPLVSL